MGLVLNLLNPFALVLESHKVRLWGIERGTIFPKVKYGSGTKHINRLGHSTIEIFPHFIHSWVRKVIQSGD